MSYPDCHFVSYLASFFGGGILGGLIAAYAAHKHAQSRERDARRFAFRCLLGEWRVKVFRSHSPKEIVAEFPKDASRFAGAYVALEPDFRYAERAKFHALCDEIVAMADAEIEKDSGILLKRIEALIEFLG